MSLRGSMMSYDQRARVRGVGGSSSLRGKTGVLDRSLGMGASTHSVGLMDRSMVVGRPRTAPVCTSHATRVIHSRRRRWISHWFSRTASASSLAGLGSWLFLCCSFSWASRMALLMVCHCGASFPPGGPGQHQNEEEEGRDSLLPRVRPGKKKYLLLLSPWLRISETKPAGSPSAPW